MCAARWGLSLRSAGLALVSATALAVAGFTAGTAAAAPLGEIQYADAADAIPGSYVVVYQDTTLTADGVAALTHELAARHRATVSHTYHAALRGFAAAMSETDARQLAADPAVAYVAQDQVVRATGEQVNPPSWGLDRVDQGNLPLNRRYVYQNTAGNVHAYVIDTGIRVSHTDFGGRARWEVNTTGDGRNEDCNGHGTHVAGTIGGARHGVAKAVRLHAVKVLGCAGGGTTASVIAGVDWVTGHRIRPAVANMSLGGGVSAPLDTAVRNSISAGVTYTVAAGNNNGDACGQSPARVAEAITVGASTRTDSRASFSNKGRCVNLFAPGVDIVSAWNTSDTATRSSDGTSMSAPHAAGAAAIFLSTHPNASPNAVWYTVIDNSTIERLSNIGSGSPNRLLFSQYIAPKPGVSTLQRGQRLTSGQYRRSDRGNHVLTMQGDGNLVHVQRGKAIWHSGTHNNPGAFVVLQGDGNVVISRNGQALWSTRTGGTPANRLTMQNDGNIVLRDAGGRVYWTSIY